MMKKEVIAHKDPKSPISEVFRTLRTNIQFINNERRIKTLLVTSTLPGEGKSWIASNLAVIFAQAGKKVVLIDADMRKGRQYVIFGTVPKPGLSNYLSQVGIKEENTTKEVIACLQKTEVKNLYLMPAGSIPPNPSELLVSAKMTKLLEKLKKVCDIVIIDGTPCELVTDAVILSRMVDSTIIVTAHKVTKKDALGRTIKSIQNVGGKISGIVINKIPVSGKKYEEKYYYYGEDTGKTNDIRTVVTEKKVETIKNEIPKSTLSKTTMSNPTTSKVEMMPKSTMNKTEEILKQMNEYLDKEKAKKEEGEKQDD